LAPPPSSSRPLMRQPRAPPQASREAQRARKPPLTAFERMLGWEAGRCCPAPPARERGVPV
jgi:hypothetical protein